MDIQSQKKIKKKPFFKGNFAFAGILFLGLFLILGLDFFTNKTIIKNEQPNAIYCDAEKVKKAYFINEGHQFSGGNQQNSTVAKSGKYSCKLSQNEVRFGFRHDLVNPESGSRYKVSVWKWSTTGNTGFLAVEGKGENGFYRQESMAVEEEAGWLKVQLFFNVPTENAPDTISIFTYIPESSRDVYVDDLMIEKVASNESENASFVPDELHLKINKKDREKLNRQKDKAFKDGILIVEDDYWVKGKLFSKKDQKERPIQMRLKGDWLDHLKGKKWSFRIKMRKDEAWRQLLTFSVQNPATRYHLMEWLFHKMLEKEDVLAPRYDFIKLKLNNEDLGIYAYEEHFEKQLFESQKRREGLILKITEDLVWLGMTRSKYLPPKHQMIQKESYSFDASEIRPFKESSTQNSETLAKQFEAAQSLLHQLKYGLKSASEVVDIQRFARFFAIVDLLDAYHGVFWHNLRFYYNPVNSKLEPVGFDGYGNTYTRINGGTFLGYKVDFEEDMTVRFYKFLFQDEAFFKAYISELQRFSNEEYIENFLLDYQNEINVREAFLKKEFKNYQFDKGHILRRAAYLRTMIEPFNNFSIQARIHEKKGEKLTLKIANQHCLPVEILGFGINNEVLLEKLEKSVFVQASPQNKTANFDTEVSTTARSKFIFFSLPGSTKIYHSPIVNFKVPENRTDRQALFENLKIESNKMYTVLENKILFFKGKHTTDQDLIFPEGYEIYFEAGTHLDLKNRAGFISKSPVFMRGTPDFPIRIFSSDQTGNGFTVLEAGTESELKFVQFEHLNTLNKNTWYLTGAVNFYESDVKIEHCSFVRNHCEDALNLIRSKFVLEYSKIAETFADGFDADFCEGDIRDVTFENTGNDATDFSGSVITIYNAKIHNAGDKGISVGEAADVIVKRVTIDGAVIGVASKDRSTLNIENITLKNCTQGFTAYQKKPEYGGGLLDVKKYKVTDVKHLFKIDEQSKLILEGKEMKSE